MLSIILTILLPPAHYLFQLANIMLLISYAAADILVLRICLSFASLFYVLWAYLILDIAVDTVIWNSIFFIINTAHAAYIIYLNLPIQFSTDYERVYQFFFGPGKYYLSRADYSKLIQSGSAQIRTIKANTIFAHAGSISDNLSLLISGKMLVMRTRRNGAIEVLNEISKFDFIDSPEWASRRTSRGSEFEVTVRTSTDCKYITWSFTSLDSLFNKNSTLEHSINGIIGVDLAKKVFASHTNFYMTFNSKQRRLRGNSNNNNNTNTSNTSNSNRKSTNINNNNNNSNSSNSSIGYIDPYYQSAADFQRHLESSYEYYKQKKHKNEFITISQSVSDNEADSEADNNSNNNTNNDSTDSSSSIENIISPVIRINQPGAAAASNIRFINNNNNNNNSNISTAGTGGGETEGLLLADSKHHYDSIL